MHRRLTANSASNLLRYVVSLGVAFFLTPFVVRTLGDDRFGFWVVVLSFVGYAGILELGVQPAVIKVVGQHKGSGNWKKLGELLFAAFLFFAGVGIVAGTAIAIAGPEIVPRLVKTFDLEHGARLLFLLIGIDVLLLFMNIFFSAVLYGWQLFPVKNAIDIAGWLVNAGIVVAFLPRGGLPLLAASKAGTDALILGATLIACRRHLPSLGPLGPRLTRESFRELLGYGGKIFISATSTRIASYTQPVIISSRLSAAATTAFAIPSRLVDYSKEIAYALSSGFMPMFSELAGRGEPGLIRSVYRSYSRYILLMVLPILVLILVYGKSFIGLWIGPSYAERGDRLLVLLTVDAALMGMQPLFWRLFLGIGRLNLVVAVSSIASLLQVGAGFLLVGSLGIEGVAYGFLAVTVPVQIIYLVYASRYLEASPVRLFLEVQGVPVALAAAYYLILRGVSGFLGQETYWLMLAGAALSLLPYIPLVLATLTRSERRALAGAVRRRLRAVRPQ
jgi:O-antigen/teichoic acid export membrane protein